MTILTPFFLQICGISHTRIKEFREYWPQGFKSEEYKDTNEQWIGKLLIGVFNEACKNIASSYLKVGGDSMSSIHFWTTSKGNLPHLSYILRKLDPLGIEFKTVTCSVTGALLFVEIQICVARCQ